MNFRHDTRGVSRLVSYTLTISVAMILITGLLFAGSQLVEDQQDRTVRSQMNVVGQQVVGSLEATDRLVRSTADVPNSTDNNDNYEISAGSHIRSLNITRQLPDSAAGESYTVEIDDDSIIVSESGSDLAVVVEMRVRTDVAETTVSGGPIEIRYDNDSDRLVVDNA